MTIYRNTDIWRPRAGLDGTRDIMAQIQDIPDNPSPVATLQSLPLEVGPLNPAGGLEECCKLPSGVWGRTLAKIDFGAF